MHPLVIRLGPITIWSHDVFVLLGLAAALIVSWRTARRFGRADQHLLWIMAGGLLAAAIFARLGLVFRYLQHADEPTLLGFFRYGGRTVLGGLAGGYAGVVLTKRVMGYRRSSGDLFAGGLALGIAIGRIGCFLAERPGTVTSVPWGVRVPADAAVRIVGCPPCLTGEPMHPSFLYESAFLVAASALLLNLTRRPALPARWMREGDLFKLFLLSYAVFRFAVEFVRGNPVMAFGLSGSQLMVLPSSMVLTAYFVHRWHRADAPLAVVSN